MKKSHVLILRSLLLILFLGAGSSNLLANSDSLWMGKAADDAAITDKDISFAVEARFVVDPRVPENEVDVITNNGVVTLSGTVKTLLAKKRATKIVESVRGVQAVINTIQVVPFPEVDDADLRGQVVNALKNDPATESFEIQVSSREGVVTLEGAVDSWQEKRLSQKVAESVRGVVKVDNRLRVHPAAIRPDFEIKAEVIRRLQSDVWVDGKLIGVMVNGGKVTLTGMVGSLAEKYSAFTDAWVSGVIAVNVESLEIDWKARDKMRRDPAELFRTDEEIREALHLAWKYDPRVDSSQIDVNVKDGIVTLTGNVTNLRAKRVAEEDAENTIGVFRVRNFLKVQPTIAYSDEEIQERVEAAFKVNPWFDRYDMKISVQDGTVFLDGYVDSVFEMTQAGRMAEKIKGVREVINRLNYELVIMGKSDERLWRDIMQAIWWDPRLFQENIHVQVEGRKVKLTGTVFSLREFRTLSQIAWEAGAETVQNRVKVKNAPAFLSARTNSLPSSQSETIHVESLHANSVNFFFDGRLERPIY